MENKIICMRGHAERAREVKDFFEKQNVDVRDFSFSSENLIYYVEPIKMIVENVMVNDKKLINKLFPHLTELPPLEEKVEEVEFWLKPFDKVVVRNNEHTSWDIDLFERKSQDIFATMISVFQECLPFNAETEKLLGTYDEPKTKYIFKGVKSYFDEE